MTMRTIRLGLLVTVTFLASCTGGRLGCTIGDAGLEDSTSTTQPASAIAAKLPGPQALSGDDPWMVGQESLTMGASSQPALPSHLARPIKDRCPAAAQLLVRRVDEQQVYRVFEHTSGERTDMVARSSISQQPTFDVDGMAELVEDINACGRVQFVAAGNGSAGRVRAFELLAGEGDFGTGSIRLTMDLFVDVGGDPISTSDYVFALTADGYEWGVEATGSDYRGEGDPAEELSASMDRAFE